MRSLSPRLGVLFSGGRSGVVRDEIEWIRLVGKERFDLLKARAGLEVVQPKVLGDVSVQMDCGEGRKSYLIEVRDGKAFARPEDGVGAIFHMAGADGKLLRMNNTAAYAVLADENKFELDLPKASWFVLMRRKIGGKSIVIAFVLDGTKLAHDESWSHLEVAVNDPGAHFILVTDEQQAVRQGISSGLARSPQIFPVDGCIGFFRVPRYLYCHPRFQISAVDAASVYSEKSIVVDEPGEAMHILSERITFRGENKPFSYFRGVCELPDGEIPSQEFCSRYLGHHSDDVGSKEHVRNARKLAHARLKTAFSHDSDKLARAEALFVNHPRGKMQRKFPRSDVLYWKEAHSEP